MVAGVNFEGDWGPLDEVSSRGNPSRDTLREGPLDEVSSRGNPSRDTLREGPLDKVSSRGNPSRDTLREGPSNHPTLFTVTFVSGDIVCGAPSSCDLFARSDLGGLGPSPLFD